VQTVINGLPIHAVVRQLLLTVVPAENNDCMSASKPSISQRSQFKEGTVEPSVPAGEFNLKADATIT